MESQITPTPEITPQPIPAPPAANPPKKSSLPLILTVVIIFAISIFSGIVLGKYLYGPQATVAPTLPANRQATLAPKPTTIPTVTPDATANWKTYNNTNGYSLRYPPEFELVKGPASHLPDEEFSTWANMSFSGKNNSNYSNISFQIVVGLTDASGKPLECKTNLECVNEWIGVLKIPTENHVSLTKTVSDVTIPGFYYEQSDALRTYWSQYLIFIHNNKVWNINVTTGAEKPNKLNINKTIIFDQILSTFRFTQ